MPSQFFNAVKPKKGSIHELSDAIPLHFQWPEWVHPFKSQAIHNLDLVTLHFATIAVSISHFIQQFSYNFNSMKILTETEAVEVWKL